MKSKIISILGLAFAYTLTAHLANQLSAPPIYASSLWLPAGIGLLGALRFGWLGLLGIFLGALSVNTLKLVDVDAPLSFMAVVAPVIISLGSTAEAFVAAWLCRNLKMWPTPPGGWRLIGSVTAVATLSCAIAAVAGALTLLAQRVMTQEEWVSTLVTWWLGDLSGMLLLFPLAYWPHRENADQRAGFVYNLLLPSMLAFALAVLAFVKLLNAEKQRQQHLLAAEASHLRGELANGADRAVSLMHALGAYIEGDEEINSKRFASYANGLRALGSSVQALQWAPRVEGQDALEAYERRLTRNGEVIPRLHPVPGIQGWPSETVMVPITYMVPMKGNEPAWGLDLWSEKQRRETLQSAWAQDEVVASPPLELVQRPGQGYAYLLDKAVWRSSSTAPMRGYVQGVFTLEQLAESALEQTRDRGLFWAIRDLGSPDAVLLESGAAALLGENDLAVEIVDLTVAGRNWRLSVASTPEFLLRTQSLNLWAAQLGSILVASVWGLFLFAQWAQTQRTIALSREVQLRNIELGRSQQLFETLARAAPTGIFQSDRRGEMSYVNPAFRQIMGLASGETVLPNEAVQVHPEDQAEWSRRRARAVAEGLPFEITCRVLTADRGARWVLAHANPVLNAEGRFDGHIGSMTDITALKRNEKALMLLNDAPTPDRESFLRHITAAMADVFDSEIAFIAEYTDGGQTRCRTLAFYCDGQFSDPFEYNLKDTPCARIDRSEVLIIHQDAQQDCPDDEQMMRFDIEAFAGAALRRLDGTMVGYVGIMRRRSIEGIDAPAILNLFRLRVAAELERWAQAEQQLALLESLESRVAERTTALRETAEQAERANRAKSDFLATMSHEIRTPMNSALGLLELVLRRPMDSDQQRMLESVQDATRSLLRLIDDLLDLSQIEAGAMHLEPESVSLAELLYRLDDLYRIGAEAKGLDFRISHDVSLAEAYWVDRLRLRQILANLLANAIKFTDRGRVSLHLRMTNRLAERDELEFQVADTGIGVDDQQLQRLFQPFTRAADAGVRQRQGSGLGLSISRRLAEMMGGSLEMRSQPGAGTQLTLRLSLVTARASARQVQASDNEPRSMAPGAPRPLVLAVEDHAPSRLLIERQLRELDYPSRLASDGEEGWMLWLQLQPQVVITDCNMPRLDGYGLTTRIREAEHASGSLRRTRIIACTADLIDSSKRLDGEMKGQIDLLLSKPLSLSALNSALQSMPDLAHTAEAPASNRHGRAMDYLATLCGGDRIVAATLLRDFLLSIADDLGKLKFAVAQADTAGSIQLLHRIKGAVSSLGDAELSELLTRLHHLTKQNLREAVQAQLEDLEIKLQQLDSTVSSL